MRKSLIWLLHGLIVPLVCVVTLTGCMIGPLGGESGDDQIFVCGQIGLKFIAWDTDIPADKRFVPVHPDDGGPAAGGVTLDMDDASIPFQMGASVGARLDKVRPYVGCDLRFNYFTAEDIFFGDDEDEEIDEGTPFEDSDGVVNSVKKQPAGDDSYGYGMIKPSMITPIPKIGVDVELTDGIMFGIEYARPWTEFTYERGHYRYGHTEPIERDSWRGWGEAFRARLGFSSDDKFFAGVEVSREHYDADFVGVNSDVDAYVFSIFFSTRF